MTWRNWFYDTNRLRDQTGGAAISQIGLRRRLLYISGMATYALKDAAFAAYVLFYYKQVLGLSGTLTGLAIALSVV
ncbi:MAG: hypothetical protein HRT77_09775 [Halioglobus sp.]|nr:hypothetical protein [Halioglobus sp.]